MVELVPALDRPFDRRKRTSRNDRRGNDHAAGEVPVHRQMRAPAEQGDLGEHPHRFRGAGKDDATVLGVDL
ncbi:hypothetical protein D9M69_556170 [compost metagenome]